MLENKNTNEHNIKYLEKLNNDVYYDFIGYIGEDTVNRKDDHNEDEDCPLWLSIANDTVAMIGDYYSTIYEYYSRSYEQAPKLMTNADWLCAVWDYGKNNPDRYPYPIIKFFSSYFEDYFMKKVTHTILI